jgi:hypothetical protein
MPRVVPSQVVQIIEMYYPDIKGHPLADFTLDRSHRNHCITIASAIAQIPGELALPMKKNMLI